jgi:FkbM family methyltransferase
MIIEIGTSDFRTQAGQVDGVFIEPVKYYFDRMVDEAKRRLSGEVFLNLNPNQVVPASKNRTHFENVAISDYEGDVYLYHINEEAMRYMGAPQWMRGCNSINEIHPSVEKWTKANGYFAPDYITEEKVRVVRIKSIIDKYNITSLDLLKIDTEGHDCIILNDYLNTVEILPKVIQFESNELSDPKEVAKVVARLKPLGYDCKQVNFDMVCKRN